MSNTSSVPRTAIVSRCSVTCVGSFDIQSTGG